jgi:hypothetical protein
MERFLECLADESFIEKLDKVHSMIDRLVLSL